MTNKVAKVDINGEKFIISLINGSDDDELIVGDINEVPTEKQVSLFKKKHLSQEEQHGCGKCGETFLVLDALNNHIVKCWRQKSNKIFSNPRELCFCCEEYLFNAHKGDYACPQCDLKFNSVFGLERHIYLLHADNSEFKCNLCNAICRTLGILSLHKKTHEDLLLPYSCDNCKRNFAYYKSLSNHLNRNFSCGPGNRKTLSCAECKEQHNSFINLQEHINGELVDYNRRNFQCLHCDKSFCSFRLLESHGLEHISYPCETCGKTFLGMGYLREHRRSHRSKLRIYNSAGNYKCYYCEESFKFATQRSRHAIIHTGRPKLYKCVICYASFKRFKERNTHMANHIRLPNE